MKNDTKHRGKRIEVPVDINETVLELYRAKELLYKTLDKFIGFMESEYAGLKYLEDILDFLKKDIGFTDDDIEGLDIINKCLSRYQPKPKEYSIEEMISSVMDIYNNHKKNMTPDMDDSFNMYDAIDLFILQRPLTNKNLDELKSFKYLIDRYNNK